MLDYSKKSFLPTFLLCMLPMLLSSCSSKKIGVVDKEVPERKSNFALVTTGPGPRLSEALQKNLSTNETSAARFKLLKFVSQKSGDGRYQECLKKFQNAPECVFLEPDWNQNWFLDETVENDDVKDSVKEVDKEDLALKVLERRKVKHAHVRKSRNSQQIAQNLRKGIITKTPNQQEGDYYRALKTFSKWSPELETLAAKLIAEATCNEPELYSYLGLKAEEFFPNDNLTLTAMALYRKADECAQKPEKKSDQTAQHNRYVQNARFRLGLLAILKNNCVEAQPVFTRLSKMGVNDYSTRALYWSAFCSKAGAKQDEFLATYDQLFKMNPLGFHTLSANKGDSLLVNNLNQPIDPIVKVRTQGDEQYNIWIQAIEDFDSVKNYNGVRKLLSPVRLRPEYLGTLEPGVRLYLSTFAFRAQDMISLFRVLDSVFRTQSEYIVDSTLKLFYPMKYLQSISEKVKRVNPFLITALIRQESAFQEGAHSRVGAVGLMQLMPRTARLMDHTMNKKKLFSPESNLKIGIRYFEDLVDRFQGDVELALAAYNAGPEAVDRWKARYPMDNRLLFLDLIPYSETRNYVTLIGRNYYWYSKIYAADAAKMAKIIAENSLLTPVEFRSLNAHAK